jgi:hypothetical protein
MHAAGHLSPSPAGCQGKEFLTAPPRGLGRRAAPCSHCPASTASGAFGASPAVQAGVATARPAPARQSVRHWRVRWQGRNFETKSGTPCRYSAWSTGCFGTACARSHPPLDARTARGGLAKPHGAIFAYAADDADAGRGLGPADAEPDAGTSRRTGGADRSADQPKPGYFPGHFGPDVISNHRVQGQKTGPNLAFLPPGAHRVRQVSVPVGRSARPGKAGWRRSPWLATCAACWSPLALSAGQGTSVRRWAIS